MKQSAVLCVALLIAALSTQKCNAQYSSDQNDANMCDCNSIQNYTDIRDYLNFTIAFTANPVINDDFETFTVGLSYHYAFCKWIAGGAEAGYFEHKYAITKGDSLTVKRPYIAPSFNIRFPLAIISKRHSFAMIPTLQAGIIITPSYSIKVPTEERLMSYMAHPAAPYLRAGFQLAINGIPVLQIGYSLSNLDVNRHWDATQRRFRSKPIHGFFFGLRLGI